MSTVVKKIICPNPDHEEITPSCALYEDGSAWCFGCQTYFKGIGEVVQVKERPSEDLPAKIAYIKALPTIIHRGLEFHHDDLGYYIVWPGDTYYKRRNWLTGDSKSRYSSPVGHRKPWLWVRGATDNQDTLVVVEGEINALSIENLTPLDIMSPGSASNFADSYMRENLRSLQWYSSIIVLADNDLASLKACLAFKELAPVWQTITISLMEIDCNDILVTHGKEKLKEELKKMGV